MPNQIRTYTFIPEQSGSYTFAASDYGTGQPMLALYEAGEEMLTSGAFGISYGLTADATYYIVGGLANEAIGSYDLAVNLDYEPWAEGIAYTTGKILTFGTDAKGEPVRYIVLQAHTSASHWFPSSTPSLYKQLEVPRWTQPLGVTDAYNTGDKVEYTGALWISYIDANVWSPGVTGWSVYNGSL
jgi:hypothetical protein